MNKTAAIGMSAAVVFGILIGGAAARGGEAASAPEPVAQPTPQVIVQTPAPVVQPTPQVIEVTPQVCRDLIGVLAQSGSETNQFVIDVLSAYLDYPNENLAEFGQRVERLLENLDLTEPPDNIDSLIEQCLGAAPSADSQSG